MMVERLLLDHEADGRWRALVADDDAVIRDVLSSLLTEAGYEVLVARNGKEALVIASHRDVSIAFIDLAMPEGNGIEVCSALRAMPKWRDIPIIVFTHYSLRQALNPALHAGASEFLSKPLVFSELVWCLESHTNRTVLRENAPSGLGEHADLQPVADRLSRGSPLPSVESASDTSEAWKTRQFSAVPPSARFHAAPQRRLLVNEFDLQRQLAAVTPTFLDQKPTCTTDVAFAPNVNTLQSIAIYFAPGVMARFLGQLAGSIKEILEILKEGDPILEIRELGGRLHNLAGTAGTLGCGSLSAAARDIQNYRFLTDWQPFIEIAHATLSVINLYTASCSREASALVPTRKQHVLVVDDQAISRELAYAFLTAAGHKVTCVESGAEALTAVAAADIQVVLMDVRMPGIDGFETARRIRALGGPRSRVFIIAVTALDNPVVKCRDAGMDSYLAKPFNPDTLLEAVCMSF